MPPVQSGIEVKILSCRDLRTAHDGAWWVPMQIGDRVQFRQSTQTDENGTIIGLAGCIDDGLTMEILLDTGAQIRIVGPGEWAVVDPNH